MVGWSNLILDPTLALIRAQLGFRIQVGAKCGKKLFRQFELMSTRVVSEAQFKIGAAPKKAKNRSKIGAKLEFTS